MYSEYTSKIYLTQETSRITELVHRTFVNWESHAEASLLYYIQNRLMPYRAIKRYLYKAQIIRQMSKCTALISVK